MFQESSIKEAEYPTSLLINNYIFPKNNIRVERSLMVVVSQVGCTSWRKQLRSLARENLFGLYVQLRSRYINHPSPLTTRLIYIIFQPLINTNLNTTSASAFLSSLFEPSDVPAASTLTHCFKQGFLTKQGSRVKYDK